MLGYKKSTLTPIALMLTTSLTFWSCSKGSVSATSAGKAGGSGTKTSTSSSDPTDQTNDSISKTLDKDNNIWKSDYQELNGFAIDVPPSELATKNILITAKLQGSEPDVSLLITGDRQLSSPVSITLPKSMLGSINGLSATKVQVTVTPTDSTGNVTGPDFILSSSDYGKIGDSFIISLSTWGSIKVGKAADSTTSTTTPTAVTIASIAPTIASGGYKVGDTITVAVTFSEAVTVTGTPKLNLNFGAPAQASYISGSGSTALIFSYTVASGDTMSALDYASTAALSLNSGTIQNSAGTAATLTLPAPGGTGSIAAAATIAIDTTAPTAPTLTGATLTNNTQPTISWTAGGSGNGTYRYKMDSSDFTSGATEITSTSMTPASALADGAHTLYVQERDAAGNWSASGSFAFTIDTNLPGAPTVTSTVSTTSNNQPTWTWTSGGNGGSGYRYKLDNNTMTSGTTSTAGTTYTPASALADGAHTLYVQESNSNGSWSSIGSYVITVDTVAPTAPVVTSAASTSTNNQPTWTWTAGGGGNGNYRVKLDNSTMTAGTTALAVASYTAASALADGAHTLYVQEQDAAGNWSATDSFSITVDTSAPTAPTVSGTANVNITTPTWSWTAGTGGNGTFRYKLDSSDLTTGATTTTSTSYTAASALTQAAHTLYVQERDAAGNWSTSGSFVSTVDTTAPLTPSLDISTKTFNSTFTVTASQNATTDAHFLEFRYTTTGSAPASCSDGTGTSGAISITGTSNVTLKVIACDAAGNASSAATGAYVYNNSSPLVPNLDISSKVFNSNFTVTVSENATPDAGFVEFRYTTTGTAPTGCSDGTATSGAISITGTSNVTLKVITCNSVGNASPVATGTYTYDNTVPLTPSIDISSKAFNGNFTVTASQNATTDANFLEFRYTTTGTAPTSCSNGTATSGAISITGTSNLTLKVIACDAAGNASASAVTATYTYDNTAPLTPSIDISTKTFGSNFTVTASQNATTDANFLEFRYTTTGTAPTSCSNGTASSGAISITGTSDVTLKVIACDSAGNYSSAVTGTYTYSNSTPLTPSIDISTKTFNSDFTVTASQNATPDAGFVDFRYTTTGVAPTGCSDGSSSNGSISITGTSSVTLKVIACNSIGNYSPVVTGTYTYDNTAPLTPSLDISTKVFNANFTVTASQNASTDANFLEFRYTTTGVAPTSCSNGTASSGSISITGTSDLTLKLIACDSAGNASSVVTGTYTYDSTLPLTPSIDIATKTFGSNFTVTASQNASTDANFLEFRYTTTGTAPTSCSNGTASSGSISITGTSNVTLKVIACDAAGNASAAAVTGTYTYDGTAPLTPSLDISTKVFNANFTVTASQNASPDTNFLEYRYTTTGTAPTGCSDGTASSGSISITGTSSVTLKLIACDSAGNASSAVTGTYTYDNTAPLTPSLSTTSRYFGSNFTVTASQNATTDTNFLEFRYTTTGTAPTDCSNGTASSGSISITGTSNVSLKVIACDAAGNASASAVTGTYTYDGTAPLTPSLDLATKTFNADFTVTASQNATTDTNFLDFRYTTTGTAPADCSSGTTSSGSISITGTSSVTLKVIACDSAGNASSAVTGTYTYDNTAPTSPTISISSAATYTTSSSITLGLSAVGASEMYVTNTSGCGSGGSYETYATTKVWSLGQTNGTATVYVKYKDDAGNETSCINDTIVHDGTNPTAPASIDDGTTNTSLTTSPTITWTASTDTGGSGISYYEIAIGTTAGGTETKTWTSTGSTSASGQATGLTLTAGTTYYASVRAVDAAGNTSSVGQGNGWVPAASLTCPTNYVVIPADATLGTADFCVMKYEAKIVGVSNGNKTYAAADVANSRSDGTPWVNMTQINSVTECQALSYAGSDLPTNAQWQAIARNIELAQSGGTYLNWSNGAITGTNAINRGNSDGANANLAASTDNDPCYGTGQASCATNSHTDFTQKRTHTLSNGEIIWDIAGNATEWVKDLYTNQGTQAYVSQLSLSAALKLKWGPSGSYSAKNSGEYGGLGYGSIAGTGGAVTRGGYYIGNANVGIFYSYFAYGTSSKNAYTGFRCISTGP